MNRTSRKTGRRGTGLLNFRDSLVPGLGCAEYATKGLEMLPGLDKRQEQRLDWVAEGLADPQRRCV